MPKARNLKAGVSTEGAKYIVARSAEGVESESWGLAPKVRNIVASSAEGVESESWG